MTLPTARLLVGLSARDLPVTFMRGVRPGLDRAGGIVYNHIFFIHPCHTYVVYSTRLYVDTCSELRPRRFLPCGSLKRETCKFPMTSIWPVLRFCDFYYSSKVYRRARANPLLTSVPFRETVSCEEYD